MKFMEFKFEMGQIVYLKTDKDQLPRMVTAYIVRGDYVFYELSNGTQCGNHIDLEISNERNESLVLQ